MQTIKTTGYEIQFEDLHFSGLRRFIRRKKFSRIFLICDSHTLQHCVPPLVSQAPELAAADIIEVEPGEVSKDLETCSMIWQTLLENKAERNALLVNVGGGVVCDLGGFVASVYKRGVAFIHVPTSLLAMADASVGGKTGIDFAGVKNSLGTFASPSAVFVCSDFLKTLPAREFQNGLAEIYKIALVMDARFWKKLDSLSVNEAILKSVRLKAALVQKDPYDEGPRKILNFGHTVGHAIEASYLSIPGAILHGEAVVAGMIVESHIALQKKLLSKRSFDEITGVLSGVFKLPGIGDCRPQDLIELMANDKKNRGAISMALIEGIGSCRQKVDVTAAQIIKALDFYNRVHDDNRIQ